MYDELGHKYFCESFMPHAPHLIKRCSEFEARSYLHLLNYLRVEPHDSMARIFYIVISTFAAQNGGC
jgi:hypothetical protein